jgi:hypothetical protein
MAWMADSPPRPHTQARQAKGDLANLNPIILQGPRHDSTLPATLASPSAGPRILPSTTERSRPYLASNHARTGRVCSATCLHCVH